MSKTKYSWWVKERHNPQLGVCYSGYGQLSKTAAKKKEDCIYGWNVMLEFHSEEEYNKFLESVKDKVQ